MFEYLRPDPRVSAPLYAPLHSIPELYTTPTTPPSYPHLSFCTNQKVIQTKQPMSDTASPPPPPTATSFRPGWSKNGGTFSPPDEVKKAADASKKKSEKPKLSSSIDEDEGDRRAMMGTGKVPDAKGERGRGGREGRDGLRLREGLRARV